MTLCKDVRLISGLGMPLGDFSLFRQWVDFGSALPYGWPDFSEHGRLGKHKIS